MAAQSQSLSSILARASIEDPEEVLQSAEAELKKNQSDSRAQHAKVVALLKLDRYDDALRALESAGDALKEKARIELAYIFYKLGRLQEAAEVAQGVDSRAAKHIAAQALYRAENFQQAAEIYRQLEKEDISSEEHDIRINKGAVDAQLTWQGKDESVQKKRPDREDLEAFETAFNAACGSIARGELSQADVLLRRARELCRHSDLPEDEKTSELLNINIQQLYVLVKLGKKEDAEKLASEIQTEEISDASTKKVAQSTFLSLQSQPSNPFLLHKTFHSIPTTAVNNELFSFQSDVYTSNSLTVDLLASKFDGVERSTSKAIKMHSENNTSPSVVSMSVLNAAAHTRGSTGKTAIKAILPLHEQRPNEVGLVLVLVQLYITESNPSSAIDILESFFKKQEAETGDLTVRYNPGLIATLIALYKLQGRTTHITRELTKAATYWRQNSERPSQTLLMEAGKALLQHSTSSTDLDSAREIFSTLYKQYPEDKEVIAGFIASHSSTSPDSTQLPLNTLPPVSGMISDVDVAALEEAGIPHPPMSAARKASLANALIGKRRANEKATGPAKRRRLPKSRIPKDYVEGKQLDPDRWLPLRERASYRPKKSKKGKNKEGGGTQGGVVKEDIATAKVEQPGVIGGGGGGGGGKKKGKGKKK